ncbi:MAG: uroporphyrinogen-III synthase [Alphaproteobacteria bacterium]|jgi:uroporphyrinogen-III synthase|nr:uroporphyrinogen-III synthase [Alphaproteobacteria bacterium]
MRILVTRPAEQAAETARHLAALGHDVLIDPLLEIVARPGDLPPLDGVAAVLVTSVNGARALAAATPRRDVLTVAVGGRTAADLAAAGFAAVVEAGGDARAMLALVRQRFTPGTGRLLHVSGADVAADLVAELRPAGYDVVRAVLYEARAASRLDPATVAALKATRLDAALFFSPRTAALFARLSRREGVADAVSVVRACCLSAAVAAEVRALPWAAVHVSAQPTAECLFELL